MEGVKRARGLCGLRLRGVLPRWIVAVYHGFSQSLINHFSCEIALKKG